MDFDDELRSKLRPRTSSDSDDASLRLPALKSEVMRRVRGRRVATALASSTLAALLIAGGTTASVIAINARSRGTGEIRPAGSGRNDVRVSVIEMQSVGATAATPDGVFVDSGNTFADSLEGLSRIDPVTNEVEDLGPVSLGGDRMTFARGNLWITGGRDLKGSGGWIERVDASGTSKIQTLRVTKGLPFGVAVDDSGVWIANLAGNSLWVADLDGMQIRSEVEIGAPTTAILSAYGSIWATTKDGRLIGIDPSTRRPSLDVDAGKCPHNLSAGEGSIWIVDSCSNTLQRFDPDDGRLEASVATGDQPSDVVVAQGRAWVANAGDDSVIEVDTATNEAIGSPISVGSEPHWMVLAFGDIWTVNLGDTTITRLTPIVGDLSWK